MTVVVTQLMIQAAAKVLSPIHWRSANWQRKARAALHASLKYLPGEDGIVTDAKPGQDYMSSTIPPWMKDRT